MLRFARKVAPLSIVALAIQSINNGSQAAQLHVRPVMIDLTAPAAAATLKLTNRGRSPITTQVRIFEWRQQGGRDVLRRTREVVASPPQMRMQPGREYVIRVVRLSKKPIKGEQAYRLIIDQIPQNRLKGSGVVFALRYSIPVFIHAPDATAPKLSWQVKRHAKGLVLKAANSGQRHDRISNLRITLPNGTTRIISKGLAGYVLGNSQRVWYVAAKVRRGARVIVRGQGINGPFAITTRVQ